MSHAMDPTIDLSKKLEALEFPLTDCKIVNMSCEKPGSSSYNIDTPGPSSKANSETDPLKIHISGTSTSVFALGGLYNLRDMANAAPQDLWGELLNTEIDVEVVETKYVKPNTTQQSSGSKGKAKVSSSSHGICRIPCAKKFHDYSRLRPNSNRHVRKETKHLNQAEETSKQYTIMVRATEVHSDAAESKFSPPLSLDKPLCNEHMAYGIPRSADTELEALQHAYHTVNDEVLEAAREKEEIRGM